MTTRTLLRAGPLVLTIGAAALAGGCPAGGDRPATTPAAAAQKGPPSETYTVRGEVVELPETGKPQREFKVHHEAIDNFVGGKGDVVGMNAMTMSFPPGPGVSLSGLAVGDKVLLTFSVWRKDGAFDWHTTKIEPLPKDTVLVFGKARKPEPQPGTP